METELWPNFLRECRKRRIPVGIVNGRISQQSFRRYLLIQPFIRRVLSSLTIAVMQSEADAQRLRIIGMPVQKLFTGGNLKFDAELGSDLADKTTEIGERFGLNANVPLILAASTHAPEEQIILESFKQLKATQPVRLMLAPRHPERFNEVASLVQKSGMSWSRRTNAAAPNDREADVILLDTIGELPAVYSLAEIVFVGGSIVDRGGHNLLEPAAAGTVVVTGAHTHNFEAIVSKMREASAIIQLRAVDADEAGRELTETLTHLFADPAWREKLARRAKQLVTDNRGATERTMQLIAPLLTAGQPGKSQSNSILANAHTS